MHTPDLSLPELFDHLNRHGLAQRLVELARDEDLGLNPDVGDVTSKAAILATARGTATIAAREEGVVCGMVLLPMVLHAFKADADAEPLVRDGDTVKAGQVVAKLSGNLRGLLAAERTMLNFVGRLSGVATRTRAMVELVRGTPAKVFDTRKTTPGLRVLEKYAVRCGGGHCHRIGLFDAALVKDNHLAGVAPADLPAFLRRTLKRAEDAADRDGLAFFEVEVDTLEQFDAILKAGGCGVHIVLLDNMNADQLREAVRMRKEAGGGAGVGMRMELEASGGITRENLPEIASTGVDRISLGTLTHGAKWLDFGVDFAA
ncbi:MAG: carboxylating nicotinate-nucleotide diphosphorylase [Phycisphaerales bacterium]